MVGTWLGEIRSCSCLAVLLDSAWVLLNKIYQPFSLLCTYCWELQKVSQKWISHVIVIHTFFNSIGTTVVC